jgi:acetyl esterase/lipase
MRVQDVLQLPFDEPDTVLFYGTDSLQFGELRLPKGKGPHPVVVILHGGCWSAAIADLHLMDPMASALRKAGYATWNLEYRRVGDEGGGWPGTFLDVAAGVDYLRTIAPDFRLNLKQVVVAGHSAGGHLALWLGARHRLPAQSPLASGKPLALSGILSLAGIPHPESYLVRDKPTCGSNVSKLLGGFPEDFPERYRQASPQDLAPLRAPQILLTGARDGIVPSVHMETYARKAAEAGDKRIQIKEIPGAGHFEVIAPGSSAWPEIEQALRKLMDKPPKNQKS